jgi:hypothetical protein
VRRLTTVTKGEKNNQTIYSGRLTNEGARNVVKELWRQGDRFEDEPSGTAEISVNAAGLIVRYETAVDYTVHYGMPPSLPGREIAAPSIAKFRSVRTVEISNANTTQVEVPGEARKLLE